MVAPILLFCGVTYIYVIIGSSSLAGVSILVLFAPINLIIGALQMGVYSKLQCFIARLLQVCLVEKKLKQTDVRLGYVKEVLQGIKVVKLYAWEEPVKQRLEESRRLEVKRLLKTFYLRVFCSDNSHQHHILCFYFRRL